MIPDEAVEAAVHAYMQYPRTRGLDNTANMFRAALEAAAPFIAALAWDEGYTIGNAHNGRRDANPYREATK